MIETQIAQLASSCPNNNSGKLPGQPEVPPKENVSAVTTRTVKSTQEPPHPKDAGSRWKAIPASNTSAADEDQEEASVMLDSSASSWSSSAIEVLLAGTVFHRDPASLGYGGSCVHLPVCVVTALTLSFRGTSGCPGSFPDLLLGQDEAS